MDPRFCARISVNRGLITRPEVLACGLSGDQLARLLRAGELMVVRRGVYARACDWEAWDPYVERPRQRARAAHMMTRTNHVLSHDSAAHELGLAILRPRKELVHITRPLSRAARTRHGVKHHGARYRHEQVVDVGGIPVLDAARTACDMAREYGIQGGLPTFDAAMRAGVTREQFRAALEDMAGWPDVVAPRACVDLADAGAESVAETLGRLLVMEVVGPEAEIETQFPVMTVCGVMWCDLRVGRHLFEIDGRLKYRRPAEGGVAERPIEDVIWEEKGRERDVCAEGLGMSRIIWEDFWGRKRRSAAARLHQDYSRTRERLGDQLPPHLAEFAARMRGRRLTA
jgi:Transcriptional regulator, AbiEi antitoxin